MYWLLKIVQLFNARLTWSSWGLIYYRFIIKSQEKIFLLLVLKTAFFTSWLPVPSQHPHPPPPHHSFNNEWNLGPRRSQDGGWRACLFEAWTFKCLHRLFRASIPRLKRLSICWLICRRLAYYYVWKCATYATGNKLNAAQCLLARTLDWR